MAQAVARQASPGEVRPDPITIRIIGELAAGAVRQMQEVLFRTGYSTIIRESQDASCALLSADGKLAAQHVVLPLHMGAFPRSIEGVLQRYDASDMRDGDAFLVNHPYEGGSPHAPDFCVILPVVEGTRLHGFAASIAHKSDIGGPVPGSCSGVAGELFNEGLQLPPLRFMQAGRVNGEVEAIIRANSRQPDLVLGDLMGQIGCAKVGADRLRALARRYGAEQIQIALDTLRHASRALVENRIERWPDGTGEAERVLDLAGSDEAPMRVHVRVEKQKRDLHFDFSGSSDQDRGPSNVRPPLVRAACAYALIALSDPAQPINGGVLDAFRISTRTGSILDPRFPAAVNTYNPTVHAIIDSVMEALAPIGSGCARADGSGGRVLSFSHQGNARPRLQYEILAGGSGARTGLDGENGRHDNQTNGRITPVEIIEVEFPVRLSRFALEPDSGGAGTYRGGLAFCRDYEILAEGTRLSLRSSKHQRAPHGAAGGLDGATGDCRIVAADGGERRLSAMQTDVELQRGDHVVFRTPGAGGLGSPQTRPLDAVLGDVLDGYVSADRAADTYGVALEQRGRTLSVDAVATGALRRNLAEGTR